MADRNGTMVCITVQRTCERLIEAGARRAGGGPLYIVHVAPPGTTFLGERTNTDALEYLCLAASEMGADLDVLHSEDVIGTLAKFAQKHSVRTVLVGAEGKDSRVHIARELMLRLPGVEIVTVSG